MVYKKYIYKNGKKFGPYYFKSVRSNDGSVKSVYLGRGAPRNNFKIFSLLLLFLIIFSFLGYFSYNAFIVADIPESLDISESDTEAIDKPLSGEIEDSTTSEEVEIETDEEIVEEEIPGEETDDRDDTSIVDPVELNDTEIEIIDVDENRTEGLDIDLNESLDNITEEDYLNFSEEVNETLFNVSDNFTENIPYEHSLINVSINQTNLTSGTVNITNKTEVLVENVSLEYIDRYYDVKVNHPVRWERLVKLDKNVDDLKVDLPENAFDISVSEILVDEIYEIEIKENETPSLNLITGGAIFDFERVRFNFLNFLNNLFSFTGFSVFETVHVDGTSVFVDQPVKEVKIEYYLPGPVSREVEASPGKKIINISSDIKYNHVLVSLGLGDFNDGIIEVVDSDRNVIEFNSFDSDGNDLIDYIEWIAPTSNETYEISITILNVQSYPVVGGDWTVMFETTGVEDLTIKAFNGTNWSNTNEDEDLKFLEIKCGEDPLDYSWINDSIFISNYSCAVTGYEVSRVVTFGKHYLSFKFGELEAYAANDATTAPGITWEDPTPADSDTITEDSVYLNVTVTDTTNTSAFLDWNGSLVAYWSFDYSNSSGVYDNSTYTNFGEFGGGLSTDNLTSAMNGDGLNLDGNDDHIELGTISSGDSLMLNGSDLTIMAWINDLSGGDIYPRIVDKSTAGGGANGYAVWIYNQKIGYSVAGNSWDSDDTTAISYGTWHHLAIVSNQTATTAYLDGVEKPGSYYSGSHATPPNAEANMRIGTWNHATAREWGGSLDEIVIHSRALGPEEISAAFDNGAYRLYHNFTSLGDGTYNYGAYAMDPSGNLNTSTREITIGLSNPKIVWEDPTPADGVTLNYSSVYLNTTITAGSNTSSFFDWNTSLVGYWSFESVLANGTVYDNSSYKSNCLMVNFASNTPTASKYGDGLDLDGDNDYIVCGADSNFDISEAITVEAWVKPKDASGWRRIVSKQFVTGTATSNSVFQLGIHNTNKWRWSVGGVFDVYPATPTPVTDQWSHVVGTYDRNNTKMYVDGAEIYSSTDYTDPIRVNSDQNLTIGASEWNGAPAFYTNLTVDEVRIYSRALSPEEVNASFNNGAYRLYHNFTSLSDGVYNYSAYAIDVDGNLNISDIRSLTIDSSPIVEYALISPSSPNTSVNLEGYCNASEPNLDNVTYYYEWLNNSVSFSSGYYSEFFVDDTNDSFADLSGGQVSGPTNAIDQNWDTYADAATPNSGSIEINYTVPCGIVNATLEYKVGSRSCTSTSGISCYNSSAWVTLEEWTAIHPATVYNVTVDQTCLDSNNGFFQLRATLDCGAASYDSKFHESQVWWTAGTCFVSGDEANVNNLSSTETTKAENWTFACLANDGDYNSSAWINDSVIIQNSVPDQVSLSNPSDGSSITDRTPLFEWSVPSDADSDALTYHIQVNDTDGANWINTSEISGASYTAPSDLDVDATYYWQVRAHDGESFGEWSEVWNFTLDSLVSISATTDSIDFGSITRGSTDNTSDDSPSPFVVQNDGNVLINISLNATQLFNQAALGTDSYQFKVDNTTETGSFSWLTSLVTWTAMPSAAVVAIDSLIYDNATDTAEVDILVAIPNDEPAGSKSSTVNFEAVSLE